MPERHAESIGRGPRVPMADRAPGAPTPPRVALRARLPWPAPGTPPLRPRWRRWPPAPVGRPDRRTVRERTLLRNRAARDRLPSPRNVRRPRRSRPPTTSPSASSAAGPSSPPGGGRRIRAAVTGRSRARGTVARSGLVRSSASRTRSRDMAHLPMAGGRPGISHTAPRRRTMRPPRPRRARHRLTWGRVDPTLAASPTTSRRSRSPSPPSSRGGTEDPGEPVEDLLDPGGNGQDRARGVSGSPPAHGGSAGMKGRAVRETASTFSPPDAIMRSNSPSGSGPPRVPPKGVKPGPVRRREARPPPVVWSPARPARGRPRGASSRSACRAGRPARWPLRSAVPVRRAAIPRNAPGCEATTPSGPGRRR